MDIKLFLLQQQKQSKNNKCLMLHNGCHTDLVMACLAPEGCHVPACDCQSRVSKMWQQRNTVNYTTQCRTMLIT